MNLRDLRAAINQARGNVVEGDLPAQVDGAAEEQQGAREFRIAGHPRIERVHAVDDVDEDGDQPFLPRVFTFHQPEGDAAGQEGYRGRVDAHEFDDDGNIIEGPQIPLINFPESGGVPGDLDEVPRGLFRVYAVTNVNEESGVRLYAEGESYRPFRTDFGRQDAENFSDGEDEEEQDGSLYDIWMDQDLVSSGDTVSIHSDSDSDSSIESDDLDVVGVSE